MNRFKRLLPPVLLVAMAACHDAVAPMGEAPEPPRTLHHLRWEAPRTADDFTAVATTPTGEVALTPIQPMVAYGSGADLSNLSAYVVSFWAVRGEDRSVQIDYVDTDSTGATVTSSFLHFDVPAGALLARPGGIPVAQGDSVLITISVDSLDLLARMEPSGLQFDTNTPAVLSVWYQGADPDLNTDGVVNSSDNYIEQNDLGVWVQTTPIDPWEWVPSVQTLSDKSFKANLTHFSDYVISW